jgi:hypothetical protein
VPSGGKTGKRSQRSALYSGCIYRCNTSWDSIAHPSKQENAMKASVFALGGLIILSITAANAAPKPAAAPTTLASSVACSTSGGGFGSYPAGCRNGANFKTYNECKESGVKRGWRHEDMAWYCSGLGLQ